MQLRKQKKQISLKIKYNLLLKKATYLPVGTERIKRFKGEVYRLRVLKDGFEFDVQVYKSLSAIALEITGRKISGKEFFGV